MTFHVSIVLTVRQADARRGLWPLWPGLFVCLLGLGYGPGAGAIDGTEIITTVAGNGTQGYGGDGGPATAAALSPSGVAVDSAGNL